MNVPIRPKLKSKIGDFLFGWIIQIAVDNYLKDCEDHHSQLIFIQNSDLKSYITISTTKYEKLRDNK